MVTEAIIFVNTATFLSYLIISILVLLISKKFLEKYVFALYALSGGIILIGLDNLFTLFSTTGYLDKEFTLFLGGITDFLGSISLLFGFTLVLFKLASIYELKVLEGRKKDIDFLLSSLESKASNGLSKEVINNLKKELIDIEKRMEELR